MTTPWRKGYQTAALMPWWDAEGHRVRASEAWVSKVLAPIAPRSEIVGEDVLLQRAIAARIDVGEVQFQSYSAWDRGVSEGLFDDPELIKRQLAGEDGDPWEREKHLEALRQRAAAHIAERQARRAEHQQQRHALLAQTQGIREICPRGHSLADAVVTTEARRGGIVYRRCRTCLNERNRTYAAKRRAAA